MKQNLETNLNISQEKVGRMEDSFNYLSSLQSFLLSEKYAR